MYADHDWIPPASGRSHDTKPRPQVRPTKILVVDNVDSFVFTIVGYLEQLGAVTDVVRNRRVDPADVPRYDGVLLSPGPGTPDRAGRSPEVILECARHAIPMLGVCLGHQGLGEVFGATVIRAPELLHGKTSRVYHDGTGVLRGLPDGFIASRYHSLAVDPATLPGQLVVNARTESGIIMGLRHASLPLHGVQFHPESVLTQGGHRLLANWLTMCGSTGAQDAAVGLSPLVAGGMTANA